ncbi:MAG: hypothetical protein N2484_06205 [Clostridia bacterium]|nr:hypothetical protein [Clostridia bacterium]
MQSIEQITKIIANIMALSAIPSLAITIIKYFYEKNKDTVNRVKNGYMPLYEFFFRERFSKEYVKNEIAILARSSSDSLYDLIRNKGLIDKSLLPFKLVKLLCEYEFYMDIINTGLEYLEAYENSIEDSDPNGELQQILDFKEAIGDHYAYGVVLNKQKDAISFEGVYAEDYISMIENALNRVRELYLEIEKNVFSVIGKPKYLRSSRNTLSKAVNTPGNSVEEM